MTTLSQRLGLAAFVVLSGALATNVFILQPPGRGLTLEARLNELNGTSISTATAPTSANEPNRREEKPAATGSSELTRAIQRELKAKGYQTGAVDGVDDLITKAAIMAYEADSFLPLTGEPRQELLQHIVLGMTSAMAPASPTAAPTSTAEAVIRAVQTSLTRLGYDAGPADGRLSEATINAIRAFETAQRLRATGRISGELAAKLGSLGGEAPLASP